MSQSRGSRLPGDSEHADRHKSEERAEARLSGELADRFTDYVEAHGLNKSEVVRDALDEFLPTSERSQYILPRDPKLADAYLVLAGDEKRLLSVERVESILCETSHQNTSKKLIKEDVLEPLKSTGLIGVRYGTVAVHPLTSRMEAVEDV